MTARQPKFPWSDQQIHEALGPHGIPDPDDEKIIRDLAEVGAKHILDRRSGGRKPTISSSRGEIRRMLVSIIFEGQGSWAGLLPPRLGKTPTSPRTLRKVRELLEQCGHKVSEATVLKDVRKLGSRSLRKK